MIYDRKKLGEHWILLCVDMIGLLVFPIGTGMLRLSMLIIGVLLYLSGLYIVWESKVTRYLILSLSVVLVIFLLLPINSSHQNKLRTIYIDSLKQYENVSYVWGGENRFGIDCSGLVRKGLIRANFIYGIASLNPRLLRESFSLWWYDASAKALRDKYRNKTVFLFEAGSINQLEHSKMLPGDFAITSNGIHALVYLGDMTWIEADPDVERVIVVKVPTQTKNNYWFNQSVHIMRWKQLID